MSAEVFVVTIDGPAGAGKSTTSRAVAERLGLHYLDSGALYRAVGLAALDAGIDPSDDAALAGLLASVRIVAGEREGTVEIDGRLCERELRTPAVSQAASKASAQPSVRDALLGLQRAARRPPGTVAEGRDMGTVVFPDADLKVFLDADDDERARRRTAELVGQVPDDELAEVRAQMAEKNARSAPRAEQPVQNQQAPRPGGGYAVKQPPGGYSQGLW